MSVIALIAVCVSAFQIEVALAPDQPIPHVYVEDPLILELTSESDQDVDVTIEVVNDIGESLLVDLGTVELRAHSAYWRPVEVLPEKRGRYEATIRITRGDDVQEETHIFARIDRPVDGLALPVGININAAEPTALRALPVISVRYVRLNTTTAGFDDQVDAAAQAGLAIVPIVGPEADQDITDHILELIEQYGDRIVRIDVHGEGGITQLHEISESIQAQGAPIPIALVVDSPAEFAALLRQGVGRYVSLVVINQAGSNGQIAAAFRRTAERAGYERMPLHISSRGSNHDEETASLVERLVLNAAAGIGQTNLDVPTVFSNGSFGPGYVPLGGFARRLHGADYVGDLPAGSGNQAHVFRIEDGWCVVGWTDTGSDELTLAIGDAQDLSFGDAYNNELERPEINDGRVRLPVSARPFYLSGSEGNLLVTAAQRMAEREARTVLENEMLREEMPSDLIDILSRIAENNGTAIERQDFFTLVRHFPYFEREWHGGGISRSSAVVAMASLARLVRHLGIIEESRGEPFIEPFQETLDRSSDYQSRYLTRSGGSNGSQERADWILKEVGRLTEEAEKLMAKGRSIEANSVATTAEWRARTLEFAADAAPLSQPEPSPDPPEEDEPDDEAEDVEETDSEQPDEDDAEDEEVADADDEVVEEGPQRQVFQVQRGENPWAIAQKHGVELNDLRRWNNWGQNPTLSIGQEYVIYK